jgi:hypothetical protein
VSAIELIEQMHIEAGTLWVRPCSDFGTDYLLDDFWAVYPDDLPLAKLGESVALIPFVLNVAPVVWLSGKRYRVPTLDSRLAAGLDSARDAFRRMYPELEWEGELVPDRVDEPARAARGRPALADAVLFSGGVDSTFSSITAGTRQLLVTVRGADIGLENAPGWGRVRRTAQAFADSVGHSWAGVESNLRRFLRTDALESCSPRLTKWWAQAQHGLALAGLAAPLAASHGCSRVLLPASHTQGFHAPWGSSPELDPCAAWDDVEVVHHGFDHSRQDKLRRLVADSGKSRPIPLRVCFWRPRGDGGNCCECEKCLRTATGLLIEGAAPARFGFAISEREVERRVRAGFGDRVFPWSPSTHSMWQDIQDRTREQQAPQAPPEYLAWLSEFDFDTYTQARKPAISASRQHRLRSGAGRMRRALGFGPTA